MLVNKVTAFDEQLRVSVNQNVNANSAGKDAGGNDIVLDVGNMVGQALQLNLKTDTAANTNVTVFIETCLVPDFSGAVYRDEVLNIVETNAKTNLKLPPAPFAPKQKFLRIFFEVTSGNLSNVLAWISPN